MESIYMIQFWIKDKSTLNFMNPQSLLLYSCNGICKTFFNNIQPCNLYLDVNKKYRLQIERYLRKICSYNIVIEGIVERMST